MLKEFKEHKRHEQPKAREWLDIETAPKDGTVVDIFRGDWKERMYKHAEGRSGE